MKGYKFPTGHMPWNKGKKGYHIHSEEHKAELSRKFKGRPSPMRGRKHTEEGKNICER